MIGIIGTFILRIFLLVVFIGFSCVLLITFLNRRSAKEDENFYDPDYRPDELSPYETRDNIVELESNPRSTGFYRLDMKRK
jgi:hypothetical protein